MSTFKCGLRRFDGHGTSSSCSPKTPVAKEVESAYSRMMRQRDQQDRGEYTRTTEYRPERDDPKVVVPIDKESKNTLPPLGGSSPVCKTGLTYSLSDASPSKNTE
jgi:hypothetical protein